MTAATSQPLPSSYATLPGEFYAQVAPTPVAAPRLLRLNRGLAEALGLSATELESPEGVALLAGNRPPESGEPIAMAYAGHQFGNWVPQLGDGRAILIGEVVDRDGVRRELQLKGAGPTPFSRRGDGRSALGPVLREYVVSEAMHALGVPTTRALAMVATGEHVLREQPEPGGILTRVSAGHVRVGTFQYFHARDRDEAVRQLADYVIDRRHPDARETANPYRALLDAVIERQAELVARWLLVGFIHGVMNTDNMSVFGETLDYGPCAFLDEYDPRKVFSSIDRGGRYAYDQQPGIALWNLARLSETLLPLLADDGDAAVEVAQDALGAFAGHFERHYEGGLCRKIGFEPGDPADVELASKLLGAMASGRADFTNTFRGLGDLPGDDPGSDGPVRSGFEDPTAFDAWAVEWRSRLAAVGTASGSSDAERRAAMRAVNPAIIPRNHRIAQAIAALTERDDAAPLDRLIEATARPFESRPELADLERPPEPDEVVHRTFCGT